MAKNVVTLLNDSGNRSHHNDVIVAGATGNLTQSLNRILHSASVHITKINSAGSGELLGLAMINYVHHKESRSPVLTVENIIDHC